MYSVLEYLEESAAAYPEKTAFEDMEEAVSFQELLRRAKRIGTALAGILPPGSPVPVFLPKSVKAVEVFLGAVYAGCFYSMLDRKQPAARLSSILDTLAAPCVVTDREGEQQAIQQFGRSALLYEELVGQEPDEALLGRIRAGHTDLEVL